MTYDQFWNQDVELVKAYREADKIKRDLKNQDMWMQGAYYYEALLDAAPVLRFSFSKKPPKPIPYREQPFELHTGQRKAADSGEKQLTQQENGNRWAAFCGRTAEQIQLPPSGRAGTAHGSGEHAGNVCCRHGGEGGSYRGEG